MQLIKNNPYRLVGLLVGASAKEQERQARRLRQFIETEQEPDFRCPILGKLNKGAEILSDKVTKLNLCLDKLN